MSLVDCLIDIARGFRTSRRHVFLLNLEIDGAPFNGMPLRIDHDILIGGLLARLKNPGVRLQPDKTVGCSEDSIDGAGDVLATIIGNGDLKCEIAIGIISLFGNGN